MARVLVVPMLIGILAAGCEGGTGPDGPGQMAPERPTPWVEGAWTQPVPAWGSPVRLSLPVPLESFVLGPGGGIGAFGAHQGGHVEGLNHVWIEIIPGTIVRSWAAGTVTAIDDMGDRGNGNGQHEFFVTIDYGQGLVGTHIDVDVPLVRVGDHVAEGASVARGPSAEFRLIDNNRTDGERTGGTIGSPVSPFDYLKDAAKAALVARHVAEVVIPFFASGRTAGNSRPWEPYLTNRMLFHAERRGTVGGEWLLTNKGWTVADPVYYDLLTIFDVTNAYGHFQRLEAADENWSLPGSKRMAGGAWSTTDGAGRITVTLDYGATWYGLYTVDESSGRARLTLEWSQTGYPAAITSGAAVYVERAPIYVQGDAQALGILP